MLLFFFSKILPEYETAARHCDQVLFWERKPLTGTDFQKNRIKSVLFSNGLLVLRPNKLLWVLNLTLRTTGMGFFVHVV